MTTLFFTFASSLAISLGLTPLVRAFALRFNLVYHPTERCTHDKPIPRIGGIVLYFSFFGALGLTIFLKTDISQLVMTNPAAPVIMAGATLIFLTGFLDDLKPLSPLLKLIAQTLVGLLTYLGGIKINILSVTLSSGIELGWLAFPVTLFWIILVTNALNLIDGLDGLAAGITLFASLLMLITSIMGGRHFIALGFAGLAGATLGFLRYNFNPASIFMGDGGSYLLGYLLAVLSIIGSVKSQTTVALLFPFLVLGVPIFDALLSPIRRIALGNSILKPDTGHVHHKLLDLGLSQRKAAITLYAITLVLGVIAFALVHARDERTAIILTIPCIAFFLTFHRLGYYSQVTYKKINHWYNSISNITRNNNSRFSKLKYRLETAQSIQEHWKYSCIIFKYLGIEKANLQINNIVSYNNFNYFYWINNSTNKEEEEKILIKLIIPLVIKKKINNNKIKNFVAGHLYLSQKVNNTELQNYSFDKIEQTKISMIKKISLYEKIEKNN